MSATPACSLIIATAVVIGLGGSGGARAAGFNDVANPPEDPLPPLPRELTVAPAGPEYAAPSPQELLKDCKSKDFVECMREWRPPPPPPPPPPEPPKPTAEEEKAKEEEAKRQAAGKPPPPPPGSGGAPPDQPPENAALTPGKPPPPNPAADKAQLDALAKAIRDAGLADKIKLPDAVGDGNVEMKLDDKKAGKPPAAKK
jgi:periplasmic protein TonB